MDAEGTHQTRDVVSHCRFRQRQHFSDLRCRATTREPAKDLVLPSRQRIVDLRAGLSEFHLCDTEDADDAPPVIERDAVNLDGNLIAGRDLQDRPIVACRGTSQQLACDFDFDARLLAPREERDDPAAAGLTNQLTRFRILPTKPSVIVDHPCGDANRIERLLDIAAEPGIGVSIGDGCYLAVRAECIDENFESFGLGCGLDIT